MLAPSTKTAVADRNAALFRGVEVSHHAKSPATATSAERTPSMCMAAHSNTQTCEKLQYTSQ